MMKAYCSGDLDAAVIQEGFCIGCGACIHLCPYFQSYRGKTARLFPCSLEEGRCFAFCPKVEVDLDALSRFLFGKPYGGAPLGDYRSLHISRAGEKVKGRSFQAGGSVSALMYFALREKLIRGAILTGRKGLLPVPHLVTKPSEVFHHGLSKYTAAPTLSAMNEAVDKGYGDLGIVATPCQATAIAQMRMNPLENPSFQDPTAVVIGLFCTWALDFRMFEAFLAREVSLKEIVKIDIPPPPASVLEVYLQDGKREFPLEQIRPLVPATCGYCPDMTAEFADLSVGVLEGRGDMNTLIIRTERGEGIAREAVKQGYIILEDMPQENLQHLEGAAANKKHRGLLCSREAGKLNGVPGKTYLRLNEEVIGRILSDRKEVPCHT